MISHLEQQLTQKDSEILTLQTALIELTEQVEGWSMKQSIKTIRDKVVTLKLYRADTEEALTEDDMQKLAYDTPIMELTPMVTHALNHKKDRDYVMKR